MEDRFPRDWKDVIVAAIAGAVLVASFFAPTMSCGVSVDGEDDTTTTTLED